MLPRSTILTVHTPLTDETRNLIGAAQIERMQRGVRLINCARGGIYDEAAMVEGLKSGTVGGRGARCVHGRALHRQPAVRHAQRPLHAPLGRPAPKKPRRKSRSKGSTCSWII